jgi:phosphoribosylanthranilate isomerase
MRVKICGITRPEDALAAEEAGADAIGLIFVERSKRYVTVEQATSVSAAVGPFMARVGVFVDAPLAFVREVARELRLSAVQLHGREDAAYAAALRQSCWVIKAFSFSPSLRVPELRDFPADAVLLDGLTPGSGEAFDWQAALFLRDYPRLVLAGGLTPETVGAGIEVLRPYAVDVASGVEASPGIKSAEKIKAFVGAAKSVKLSPVIHSYPQAAK